MQNRKRGKGGKRPPVIVVPGITATGLEDFYPVPSHTVWSPVFDRDFDGFALHPDNDLLEADQPGLIRPMGLFSLVYRDLIQELRSELGAPVFPFAYDWRRPLEHTSRCLARFVDEVRLRCSLMPGYGGCLPRVDLVGHSMGGLVLAGYLAGGKGREKVRKAATIGAPFKGSVDAVLKLIAGKGAITGRAGRDRERVASRSVPAIYHLLPRYPGAVVSKNGAATDLFLVETWQGSLLRSLERFIKETGARISARKLLERHLGQARAFLEKTDGLDLGRMLPGGGENWLCMAGVGCPTQQEIVNNRDEGGGTRFEMRPDVNDWESGRGGERTGDGVVPFAGACPDFLPRKSMVCVSPKDFSRWEIRDMLLSAAVEFHAFLPAVNLVQRLVIKFLKPSYGGEVWGWPPPGVEPDDWRPPLELEMRERSFG